VAFVIAALLVAPSVAGASSDKSRLSDVEERTLGAVDVEDYPDLRREITDLVNAGELGRLSRARRNEPEDSWATRRRLLAGKRSIAAFSLRSASSSSATITESRRNG